MTVEELKEIIGEYESAKTDMEIILANDKSDYKIDVEGQGIWFSRDELISILRARLNAKSNKMFTTHYVYKDTEVSDAKNPR